MNGRLRILLAVWLALQFALAQQFALAHWIGHLAQELPSNGVAAPTAADGEQDEAGHALAHACETCVGLHAFGCQLGAGDVPAIRMSPASRARATDLPATEICRPVLAYYGRAPPGFQY